MDVPSSFVAHQAVGTYFDLGAKLWVEPTPREPVWGYSLGENHLPPGPGYIITKTEQISKEHGCMEAPANVISHNEPQEGKTQQTDRCDDPALETTNTDWLPEFPTVESPVDGVIIELGASIEAVVEQMDLTTPRQKAEGLMNFCWELGLENREEETMETDEAIAIPELMEPIIEAKLKYQFESDDVDEGLSDIGDPYVAESRPAVTVEDSHPDAASLNPSGSNIDHVTPPPKQHADKQLAPKKPKPAAKPCASDSSYTECLASSTPASTSTAIIDPVVTTDDLEALNQSFITFAFPEEALASIWQCENNYLEAKIGPYKLYGNSFHCLKDEKSLTDEILNAYLFQSAQQSKYTAGMIDSHILTRILEGHFNHKNYELSKFDFLTYEIVVGAINENGNHWSLLIIYPNHERIVYLNPLGRQDTSKKILKNWRNFMYHRYRRQIDTVLTSYTVEVPAHPKQKDSFNCGAFVMKFADCYLQDVSLESLPNDIVNLQQTRKAIALTLLDQSEAVSDYCRMCGMVQTDSNTPSLSDKWVKCDQCTRWFHQRCLHSEVLETRDFEHSSFNCQNCGKSSADMTAGPSTVVLPTQDHQDCLPTNAPAANPYWIMKRSKRVKRCQDCREAFADLEVSLCIMHFEDNPFYLLSLGAFHSAWRNYYYHLNIECIKITNPKFSISDIVIHPDLNDKERNFIVVMGFL